MKITERRTYRGPSLYALFPVMRLTVDLQPNFALNQPLSPFALAVFELLDPESPTYALDMISILESTLDDPRPVLQQQQFMARGEAVAAMKAEGIDMETATIFLVGFANGIPKGALLLVSDNPMTPEGVKTGESDRHVTDRFVKQHLDIGLDALRELRDRGESVKHLRFE